MQKTTSPSIKTQIQLTEEQYEALKCMVDTEPFNVGNHSQQHRQYGPGHHREPQQTDNTGIVKKFFPDTYCVSRKTVVK
jgi:hypothetical protein